METKTVIIERAPDGGFSAYVRDEMPYGLLGEGDTWEQTIEDFYVCVEDMRDTFKKLGEEFEEFKYVFIPDEGLEVD